MSVFLFVIIAAIGALVILLVGRAMGSPAIPRRFDETPADVTPMDASDGTPLGHWGPDRRKAASAEDVAIMERFSNEIKSERRP